MKTVISLGLLLAASHAALAQPVTSPATCAVKVLRAPDDVRQIVEAWVQAEPRCSVALEVRIIPTDGGLYLFALDERGRIRERMVPDAQSAGVLVASWVADDTMYTPPPKTAPPVDDRVDPFTIRGSGMSSDLTTPGLTVSTTEPVDGLSKDPTNKNVSKWIGLGLVMTKDSNDGGVRLDADVWTRGKYSIGAALSSTSGHMEVIASQGVGLMTSRDIKLMATGSHTWSSSGRWFARGAAGVGLVHTDVLITIDEPSFTSTYTWYEAAGWTGVAEASLIGGAELGKNWSFNAGPVVTLYAQNLHAYDASGYMPETVDFQRRDLQLMFYGGLKYRL
jgi:hypothetical protein